MSWKKQSLVAFDLETSGAWPLEAEICEFAAVKWQGGQIVDSYQTLIKPTKPMEEFIINIHGITNEMVAEAPAIQDKIKDIHSFLSDSYLMAHHAPFDVGFLALEFEKAGLPFLHRKVLCTSLLSRSLFPNSINHKLQTLIKFFDLPQGEAHRALDDSKACLEVGLRCLEKLGDVDLDEVFKTQKKEINWKNFSVQFLREHDLYGLLIEAIEKKIPIDVIYGMKKSVKPRRIRPKGIVRGPDGDFTLAFCDIDQRDKRFYLAKIQSIQLIL